MEKILFLHGALGSKLQFQPLINSLSSDFECHALNFAGHGGESIPTAGLTFQTFAENILQYLNKHQIEKINLFGFSMGGYAALYFAHLHPERVSKIFTLNVKFNWDPISTAKEAGLLDAEKMLEKVPSFANNLMVIHGLHLWKSLLKSTSDMMKQLSETVTLSEKELKAISQPVLLAIGDRDQTSSVFETLETFKKLPNAAFMVFPQTAHPFERVSLALLQPAIKEFFK